MNITVLGNQGAIPKPGKFSSSLLLNVSNINILFDCCEGVQFQLRKNKIKLSKIELILISHAHGDHYFGLIGLITTMSLLRRKKKLTIFCPETVFKIIQFHINISKIKLSYDLNIIKISNLDEMCIFENQTFSIVKFPLKHSVETNGFLVKEKNKKRKLNIKNAIEKNIDKVYFNKLKKGQNVFNRDGLLINYEEVTEDGPIPKSFAYCSDTVFFDKLVDYVNEVDLLYCETTFLKKHKDKAKKTLHSTTIDAANLAKNAKVKKLLIGHFSSRYDSYDDFENEVKPIFNNVIISEEGKKILI